MRRLRLAALLVLFLPLSALWAAPAGADAQTTGKLLVTPPSGFVELSAPTGINGPLTHDSFEQLVGQAAASKLKPKDLDAALADSYAHTYVNRDTRNVLILLLYHLRSDLEAGDFLRGVIKGAASDSREKRLADGPDQTIRYDVTDPASGASGRMTVARQGRYAVQFLVVGAGQATTDVGLADTLAVQQLHALPSGPRSANSSSSDIVYALGGLVVLALIVGAVVLLALRVRRRNQPALAGGPGGPPISGWPPPAPGALPDGPGGPGPGAAWPPPPAPPGPGAPSESVPPYQPPAPPGPGAPSESVPPYQPPAPPPAEGPPPDDTAH